MISDESMLADVGSVRGYLDALDCTYARLHTRKEEAFWEAKMGLGGNPDQSNAELNARCIELSRFLCDPKQLERARALLGVAPAEEEERVRLQGWIAAFEASVIESGAARAFAGGLLEDEGRLEHARLKMPLGYFDDRNRFSYASSAQLNNMLRTEPNEALRRSAWQGLRSVETYLLRQGFVDVIGRRNRLARMDGAEDYYDWKTLRLDRQRKIDVFALLDELEVQTRCRAPGSRFGSSQPRGGGA